LFINTTMKKLLWLIVVLWLAFSSLGQGSVQAQSSNCQSVSFSDGTVCVWIERVSNGEYRVRSTISNTNNNTVGLRCDIEYGSSNNAYRQSFGTCDGTFYYASNSSEQISIDIWFNQNTLRRITQNYNFSNGTRGSSNNNNRNNNNNNRNNNNLYDLDVLPNTIFPSINQQINLNLLALQSVGNFYTNYRGTIDFSVQSQNSRWNRQTASSSDYYLNRSSYTFTSSNNGQVQLNNVVEFRNSGIYRLIIRDSSSNVTKYIQFDVSGSSNNNNNNNNRNNSYRIIASASQTNPNTNQYINVTLNARYNNNNNTATDYRGSVEFSVQSRSNNNSSWQNASSSSYDLDRSSYTFTSNNNGSVTLNSLLRFYNNGQYRLVIRDSNNNITEYIEFSAGGTNSWTRSTVNNFWLSASRNNPARNESVNVTIQARDNNNRRVEDYTRAVSFSVQSRSNNNSSWQNASSSTYYLNRSSYTFTWSDYGSVILNNLIEFSSNGDYRLVVQDSWNNIIGYYTFNVGGTNNNNNNNNNQSNTPWFSTAQLNQVQWIYNLRPRLIDDMKSKYSRLRNNSTWNTRQTDLYNEMFKITRNNYSIYSNYDQFFVAFRDRYVYTLQVR